MFARRVRKTHLYIDMQQGRRRRLDRKMDQTQKTFGVLSLRKELRGYEREGMRLYLDGRPSCADQIADACVFAEDSGYMRDFISDDKDHITEVRFIRISGENK